MHLMIDRLKKILFSTRLTAVLFIVFAVAMGLGTFIETKFSTETAKIWVYNTRWLEVIMLFFVINFIGNISRYRLLRKEKWPTLVLHLSWILIIAGAAITRYIGYEGVMPIREGKSEKVFYSDKTYLTALVDGNIDGELHRRKFQDDIIVTPEALKSSLPWNFDFNNTPFTISYVDFIKGAKKGLVLDENGKEFLKIVEAGDGERHDHYLERGKIASIHNVLFALDKPTDGAINIFTEGGNFKIKAPFEGDFMRMADQFQGKLLKDSLQMFQLRSLYNVAGMRFVIPDPLVKGNYGIVAIPKKEVTEKDQDALVLDITSKGETVRKKILGSKGIASFSEKIKVGDLDFTIGYGSKTYNLPFHMKLNDFIAEKQPGTEEVYSSFMSKVTVEDERNFDFDIFMNHVLDHKGYRFFQSGFDPDEKGTVLSVNHDFWGTWVTYIGYFLLYVGLLGIMFFGDTRFKDLEKSLNKIKEKKKTMMTIVVLLFSVLGFSQHKENHQGPTQQQIDSIHKTIIVSKEHAAKFGALVIQDDRGRMMPINTFTSQVLRKLSLKNKFKDLDSDQVFLSMMLNPRLWYNTEFIAIDKKNQNDSIRNILGVPKDQKYVKATDFFNVDGTYKLQPFLKDATSTNIPNKFQKDFKNLNIRLTLLDRALSGGILKIFPLLNDENNKWISALEYRSDQTQVSDSLYGNFVKNAVPYYLMTLGKSLETGDYKAADKLLAAFKKNQENHGEEVLPSNNKIKTEIIYNKLNIFNNLFMYYALIGLLMFIILILQIFKDREIWKAAIYFCKGIIIVLFVWHTVGLILIWYVSGHAPWSNTYESIIYVAWATMAIGLALGRKSDMTIAATAFVTCMLLWVAHQNWVDPAIGNLVPVLDSYWLMIHTAVIVGSYGPLTVGMILGVVSLILMILTTKKNKKRMHINIKEITIITELALITGLVMLTIGTFLGGQWANESWGRYWGWDPKETWAFISILVYAFVIHMRLIPGLRGTWTFNFLSIAAYASIMMTYFGVNFYLVGLHSYASGSQVITPTFIWYTVLGVFILGGISLWRYKINYAKK